MTQENGNTTFTIMEQPQMTVSQKTEHNRERNKKSPEYEPYSQREVLHPTSDFETLVHLLKASLGTGILAMPMAFKNAGLWTGLIGSIIVSGICTHCVAIYIDCAYILCQRYKTPSVGFQKLTELAFLEGPECLKKFSKIAGEIVKLGILTQALGGCCAYALFVAKSIKQVVEYYYNEIIYEVPMYLILILPLLIAINLLKNLKHLTPLSMISNIFFLFGVFVSYYFIFDGPLPAISERPFFSSINQLPIFFGTTIFALEGIGVVMPLENNMRNPKHLNHWPGLLHIGMGILTILYAITGFFGYLKYGDDIEPSITLNLPVESVLGQVLKLLVAIAVFFSYSLFFYVAMDVLEIINGRRFQERKLLKENISRIATVLGTVTFAALFPKLGPLLSLVGAFSLCTLGLIFPPIVDVLVHWKIEPLISWRSLSNFIILICGIIGFLSGTITSLREFSDKSAS